VTSLVKDDWEIVCHDVLVSCYRSDCDLIKSDPVFGILLAIILFKLLELEVAGSYDLAKV
jgi:hypothetical protein